MKHKFILYTLLYLVLLSFFISCKDTSLISIMREYSEQIEGHYSTYDDHPEKLHVWIEELKSQKKYAILMFKHKDLYLISQFLKEYPLNLKLNKDNICDHVEGKKNFYKFRRANKIWTWPSNISLLGLSTLEVVKNNSKSTIQLRVLKYMKWNNGKEYIISSFTLNEDQYIKEILLSETGFIKNVIAYFVKNKIAIKKISPPGDERLLKYYFQKIKKIDHLLRSNVCDAIK